MAYLPSCFLNIGLYKKKMIPCPPALCEIPGKMDGLIDQCNKKYSIGDQVEGTFKPGWRPMTDGDTDNDTRNEYMYTWVS